MVTVVVVGEAIEMDLVQSLIASGATVHVAASAEEVLARLHEWTPDSVIADLDEVTGRAMSELPARLPPTSRVIAIADPRSIVQPSVADCVVYGYVDEPTLKGAVARPARLNIDVMLGELLSLSAFRLDLPNTLQELTTRIARAFGADDCVLLLAEDSSCYTARQVSDDVLVDLVPLCDPVCQFATTLIAPPRPSRPYRSFLGVPLAHDNATPFARLLLCGENPLPFSRDVRRHLRVLARRLSVDLSWRLVHERLEADRNKVNDTSRVDSVLGIANRAALQEELAKRVRVSERRGEPFSVAVIDVDGLRLINERNGYRAGDAVLAHIARVASQKVTPNDIVARYASDSIAVVMPGAAAVEASSMLTSILTEVDATPVVHEDAEINLTVSAGIAELHYDDDTGEAALGRAMAARQHARRTGEVIGVADASIVAEPPAPHDFAIGTTLGGVFQIRHEISRGAFGVVYRAEDLSLRRQVALKLLRPDLARDTNFVDRFRAEAEMLARIRNPHLVQVYAFGSDGPHVYFAMELVEGQALDERIASARRRRRHLPLPEVISVIEQVGEALEAVHKAGVLHRDVKPENVLIDRINRRFVLVDVGIAVRRGSEKNPAGTPGFTAPEVFGDAGETPATDVYSLGALAYLLLTLQAPFGDAGPLEILHLQSSPPTPPTQVRRDLPLGVDGALMPALDPDPTRRPQSARQLAKALSVALTWTDGRAPRAAPRQTLEPPMRTPRVTPPRQTLEPSIAKVVVRNASLRMGEATFEASTRGVLFRSAYEVLGARRGSAWMAEVTRKMPGLIQVLAPEASSLAWHPTTTFIAVLESLASDDQHRRMIASHLGRTAVEASFTQFYGANPSAISPAHVLGAVEMFWRSYHNWGVASVTTRENDADVVINNGLTSALLCASTAGLLAGVVSHAGGQAVDVEHPSCTAHGAKHCVFHLAWRDGERRPSQRGTA